MAARTSELVNARISIFIPPLTRTFSEIVRHSKNRETYQRYLIFLHGFVRASVPLMQDAVATLTMRPHDDPYRAPLIAYFEQHIEEEWQHDEWLLEDLGACGVSSNEVLETPPSRYAAGMVGNQYYWIRHYHPFMLLGYIAVLEGYPLTLGAIAEMQRRTRLSAECFRTLRKHAELDPGHKKEFDELLDKLPMGKKEVDGICGNASTTVWYAVKGFDEILELVTD